MISNDSSNGSSSNRLINEYLYENLLNASILFNDSNVLRDDSEEDIYSEYENPELNLTLLQDAIWSGTNSSGVYLNESSIFDTAETKSLSVSLVTTGIGLYILSFITFVGNAMVLHAIRTEKRLQTVRKI